MADRLYTSSEADEVLSALRFETKLEKAVPRPDRLCTFIGERWGQRHTEPELRRWPR